MSVAGGDSQFDKKTDVVHDDREDSGSQTSDMHQAHPERALTMDISHQESLPRLFDQTIHPLDQTLRKHRHPPHHKLRILHRHAPNPASPRSESCIDMLTPFPGCNLGASKIA